MAGTSINTFLLSLFLSTFNQQTLSQKIKSSIKPQASYKNYKIKPHSKSNKTNPSNNLTVKPNTNSRTGIDGPLVDEWFCTYCGKMGFGNHNNCPYCGRDL
jgi:rubrerythrin